MPHRPRNSVINRCPRCHGERLAWPAINNFECSDCGFTLFLNTAAAVAVIVDCRGEILFGRRKNDPGRGMLDLPGGFVDPGETAEEAAIRELKEETELSLTRLQYLSSHPNTYPYRDVVYHTLDLVFLALLDGKPAVQAGDDLMELLWVPAAAIEADRIAFSSLRNAVIRYLAMTRH